MKSISMKIFLLLLCTIKSSNIERKKYTRFYIEDILGHEELKRDDGLNTLNYDPLDCSAVGKRKSLSTHNDYQYGSFATKKLKNSQGLIYNCPGNYSQEQAGSTFRTAENLPVIRPTPLYATSYKFCPFNHMLTSQETKSAFNPLSQNFSPQYAMLNNALSAFKPTINSYDTTNCHSSHSNYPYAQMRKNSHSHLNNKASLCDSQLLESNASNFANNTESRAKNPNNSTESNKIKDNASHSINNRKTDSSSLAKVNPIGAMDNEFSQLEDLLYCNKDVIVIAEQIKHKYLEPGLYKSIIDCVRVLFVYRESIDKFRWSVINLFKRRSGEEGEMHYAKLCEKDKSFLVYLIAKCAVEFNDFYIEESIDNAISNLERDLKNIDPNQGTITRKDGETFKSFFANSYKWTKTFSFLASIKLLESEKLKKETVVSRFQKNMHSYFFLLSQTSFTYPRKNVLAKYVFPHFAKLSILFDKVFKKDFQKHLKMPKLIALVKSGILYDKNDTTSTDNHFMLWLLDWYLNSPSFSFFYVNSKVIIYPSISSLLSNLETAKFVIYVFCALNFNQHIVPILENRESIEKWSTILLKKFEQNKNLILTLMLHFLKKLGHETIPTNFVGKHGRNRDLSFTAYPDIDESVLNQKIIEIIAVFYHLIRQSAKECDIQLNL